MVIHRGKNADWEFPGLVEHMYGSKVKEWRKIRNQLLTIPIQDVFSNAFLDSTEIFGTLGDGWGLVRIDLQLWPIPIEQQYSQWSIRLSGKIFSKVKANQIVKTKNSVHYQQRGKYQQGVDFLHQTTTFKGNKGICEPQKNGICK